MVMMMMMMMMIHIPLYVSIILFCCCNVITVIVACQENGKMIQVNDYYFEMKGETTCSSKLCKAVVSNIMTILMYVITVFYQ